MLLKTDHGTVHYAVYGDPEGTPVLMIHGYMVSGDMYRPVIDGYVANGYRLIVPDLRGYGRSQMPGTYTIRQHAEDMVLLLNELGIDRAHVMGYSMGGTVAQTLVYLHPERVMTLILGCTFSYKSATPLERLQGQLVPQVLKRIGAKGIARMTRPEFFGLAGLTQADFEVYREMLGANRDEVLLENVNDIFRFDSRPWLKKITRPTLVIGAMQDFVVPVHHTYMLAGNIPGAKIKVVDGAGHALIHSHSRDYERASLDFIQRAERMGKA